MKKITFLFLLFISFGVLAQQGSPNQENDQSEILNLSSPYYSLYTFLANLQDDSYHPEISAKVFKAADEKASMRLAIQLKQILDGEGIYVELEDVPKESNFYDSAINRSRYIITDRYPSIYLERKGRNWVFEGRALQAIENAHNEVFAFGMSYLLDLLPAIGTRKIAGMGLWQIVALLGLVIICFILHKILTFIFQKIIIRYLKKSKYSELANKFIEPIAKPFSLFIIASLVVSVVPVLQLPIFISKYLLILLRVSVPLLLTIVCYRSVGLASFYFEKLAEKTKSSLDDQLVPLIGKALKAFIVIIGILFILINLNVDIIPLLTGLSIGGLAFALAAQDTIKNFFGSLMIFIDKPFQIGDWITSGEIDGTVEEVGFRSTRVRTFRNSVVYVPNGNLADSTIDNHGLRKYRRFYTQLALTYDTPTPIIELFTEGLKKIVIDHPKTRKDYFEIYLNAMADSSLNVMFYIFFKVPSWSEELKARHEIIIQIIDLAKELGVNFAFPTQTLHMENFPGKDSLSPAYEANIKALEDKMNQFLDKGSQA